VALTSHGRRAVSVSTDGTARLWDLESGKELRCQHKQKKAVYALAISPNGQQALFAGEGGIVWLWQLPQEE
jgi:WD40 repeat protein